MAISDFLNNRIPGFRQTWRNFLKSKTNQIAITTLVTTGYSLYAGNIEMEMALGLILGALFAITIKDATE